ncbi:hypothetical protein [Salinarchaeum sp. Harcht-Bsk1]|uniref:hypothetical protein n=1 Tax=Salinarchaeum sp. Harcht-Bsk1 TaxID=1333523 RepID=UPI000677B47A|nr:hypothetical protein [Salinarchaeum sp. Harcht-Bsk1]
MSGNGDAVGGDAGQHRVPEPLRERVDELFVAERGYEPASFQEALSVVVDLASAATAPSDDASAASAGPTSGPSNGTTDPASSTDADGTDSPVTGAGGSGGEASSAESSSEAGTTDLSEATIESSEFESVSFDDYVDGLDESRRDPSPGVESMLDTAHADGVVRELAAEVLDEMTSEAFDELEHGVDQGVGAGVTDGMGATQTTDSAGTAPSGSQGDGVPDSLTADPESDCAICGRAHPVSVLQTTIRESEGGSVALVCPSCAE